MQAIKTFYQTITNTTPKRRIFFSILGIALWCIIVLPVIIVRTKVKGDTTPDFIPAGYTLDPSKEPNLKFFEGMLFGFQFQSVDLKKKTVNMFAHVRVFGDEYSVNGIANQNITCDLGVVKSKIEAKKVPKFMSFQVPIFLGTPADYPFDGLLSNFIISCKDSKKEAIPVAVINGKELQTYDPHLEISSLNDMDQGTLGLFQGLFSSTNKYDLGITILLAQPVTNVLYVALVTIIMWGLSIALAIVTYDIIIHRREMPPPILAIGASILFTLPALRNTQPGIPALGCAADIAGYYWCIAIVALCTMLNIFAFTLRWRKPVSHNL